MSAKLFETLVLSRPGTDKFIAESPTVFCRTSNLKELDGAGSRSQKGIRTRSRGIFDALFTVGLDFRPLGGVASAGELPLQLIGIFS